jgi:hypothetical protein
MPTYAIVPTTPEDAREAQKDIAGYKKAIAEEKKAFRLRIEPLESTLLALEVGLNRYKKSLEGGDV